MIIFIQFIICTVVILYAGQELSKYGDILAEKTGLGRTWIGIVLMASITSLPELITGVSSVAIFNLPNLAAGDIFGSCMFNILILALLDIGHPVPLSTRANYGNVLSGSFGILLLGLVAGAIFAKNSLPSLGWIGIYSLAFILIYLLAIRIVFLYEQKRMSEFAKELAEELQYRSISKKKAFTRYAINALIIIGAATYLPYIGEEIAEITGLGQTFVGSIFIALSTSLPEVVVCFAAMRLEAMDMAFGNLFGSNLFNIAILGIDDIFYLKNPLLNHVSDTHILTAMAAIIMTAIILIGLTYRAIKKPFIFSWDSLGIIGIYLGTTFLLYNHIN